ncbi:hypothetical protein B0T22DRAFT_180854 [Podospora appendiculata]|uniref:Uncharacterized protein n=1 Tax=Podospora appendiculata TaxID=314037 RepID=A0AAE1CDT4_9PEZI|nr:hypothetical protein B0T22DRAFT_180854 [Podospora appendiculata]
MLAPAVAVLENWEAFPPPPWFFFLLPLVPCLFTLRPCSYTAVRLEQGCPFSQPQWAILLVLGKAWPRPNDRILGRRRTMQESDLAGRPAANESELGLPASRSGREWRQKEGGSGAQCGLRWRCRCSCKCR